MANYLSFEKKQEGKHTPEPAETSPQLKGALSCFSFWMSHRMSNQQKKHSSNINNKLNSKAWEEQWASIQLCCWDGKWTSQTEAENRFWKEKKTNQIALHMLKKKKVKTHTCGSCTFKCRKWDTTGGQASAFLITSDNQSKPSSLLSLGTFQKPHRVFASPGSTR